MRDPSPSLCGLDPDRIARAHEANAGTAAAPESLRDKRWDRWRPGARHRAERRHAERRTTGGLADPLAAAPGRRFDAFLDWTEARTGSASAFVLDGEGLVLVARSIDEDQVMLATALLNLLNRLHLSLDSPTDATMVLVLEPGKNLHFTGLDLGWSRFILGFVSSRQPAPGLLSSLRRKLADVIEEEVRPPRPTSVDRGAGTDRKETA